MSDPDTSSSPAAAPPLPLTSPPPCSSPSPSTGRAAGCGRERGNPPPAPPRAAQPPAHQTHPDVLSDSAGEVRSGV
ncbi:hypothetical protein CgunFtcFv8_027638 [Champsocephalus gunnari]|uniref:Uncharacterized protein n=1 Tax=Champsocephalus gunnari TaxID=52237 RepID=A0AAN8E6U2_CHAGU|nr:hypothetical protein CgunFtcFv8_027638 [Champsocephalus gunnari]